MKKVVIAVLSLAALCFSSCASFSHAPETKEWYDYFDTVVTLIGYEDEEAFEKTAAEIEDMLKKYDTILDIYSEDSELYRLNAAGGEPIAVSAELVKIIEFSKEMYEYTNGECNVAFGAVLSLWHRYRENALAGNPELPSRGELLSLSEHCDIQNVTVDEIAQTVTLEDPLMSLDMGAVAKGYVADVIAEYLREMGKTSYAVSVGGTVITVGNKPDGETFTVGVENPDPDSGDAYVSRITLSGRAVATSGSYQRFYDYGGVRYHHIIDKDTLFPENEFLSVTVVAESAALADALSTAIFNMTIETGERFVASHDGVEVLWVLSDGSVRRSDGFPSLE